MKSRYNDATLHNKAKNKIRLNLLQLQPLRLFLKYRDIRYLADLDFQLPEGIDPDSRLFANRYGSRISNLQVTVWKHYSLNDNTVTQSLFKAYIWTHRYENKGCRTACWVRYQIVAEDGPQSGIGQSQYFFNYRVLAPVVTTPSMTLTGHKISGQKNFLLAMVHDVPVEAFGRTVFIQPCTAVALVNVEKEHHEKVFVLDIDSIDGLLGVVAYNRRKYVVS